MLSSRAKRPATLHLAALLAFLALGSGIAGAAPATRSSRQTVARAAGAGDASVRVGAGVRAIPRSFLGLSFEYGGIARYEQLPGFGRLLQTLTVRGAGPMLLRIGGESADGTYLPPGRGLPGDYRLSGAWFSRLASLVRAAHVRVMFDLNLAARSPSMAAALARTGTAALPAGSIRSFEIGNEPDLFRIGFVGVRRITPDHAGAFGWALGYTPADYARDFRSYAAAVARAVPRVTFAGPAVSVADNSWWSGLPAHGRDRLGIVSLHSYPFLTCVPPRDPRYPTLAGLLSTGASRGFAAGFGSAARLAHGRGAQLRLTELDSAACGGVRGATDTFASALWVADALFSLVAAGVDGVNIHTRLDSLNTPLFGLASLSARPMMYGMVLFERTLGPGARLLAVRLRAGRGLRLSAWAVRLSGGALQLLLINRGARAARVALRLGGRAPGQALYLRAPSLSASSHVTLGGASLRADGRWDREQRLHPLTPAAGVYRSAVPPFSAVLVSVPRVA